MSSTHSTQYRVTYKGGHCVLASDHAKAEEYIRQSLAHTDNEASDYRIEHRAVTIGDWHQTTNSVRRSSRTIVEVTLHSNDALIGSWFEEAAREGTDGIYLDLPDNGGLLPAGTRVIIYNTTDKAVYVGDVVNWVASNTYVVKGA
jgi:hypothetical protein